jgi:hypothetical protein
MLSMSWSIQRADPWRAAVLALAEFHGQPPQVLRRQRRATVALRHFSMAYDRFG